MIEILQFVRYLLYLYSIIIVAGVILSWLIRFNVINPYNTFVRNLMLGLDAVTEPALEPIRRLLPRSGGVDFSPLVLLLVVYFLQEYLIGQCGFGIIMRQLC
jgi:YggT family protein